MRSRTLFVVFAAATRASFVHLRRREKVTEDCGLSQSWCRVWSLGARRSLYASMPGSDQIILCLVLRTSGAFLSRLGLVEGLTGSWKEEIMMSCLESTLGLVLEQSTSMTDS